MYFSAISPPSLPLAAARATGAPGERRCPGCWWPRPRELEGARGEEPSWLRRCDAAAVVWMPGGGLSRGREAGRRRGTGWGGTARGAPCRAADGARGAAYHSLWEGGDET